MDIQVETRKDAVLLHLEGDLDMHTARVLLAAVEANSANAGNVIISLAKVGRVDSTGMGMLFRCRQKLVGEDRTLVLVGVNEVMLSLFRLVHMEKLFEVWSDERLQQEHPAL